MQNPQKLRLHRQCLQSMFVKAIFKVKPTYFSTWLTRATRSSRLVQYFYFVVFPACDILSSESEKARRWDEIRVRQHRLRSSGFHRGNPMEQSMLKSGFTMSDIKGFTFFSSLLHAYTLLYISLSSAKGKHFI